jgi:CMP-N-acetylneuraminic acid synthetase
MAGDDSSVFRALAHAARRTVDLLDFRADYVVTAQPTYPLMQPDQIDAAVEMAVKQDADSVITAVEIDHDAHPFNIRQQGSDGRVSFWKKDEHYAHPNRQQKPSFYQFGNIFVSRFELLVNHERLEGEDNYLVEVDRISTLDVNTPEDLDIVEYHLRKRREKDD